jgi:hypothetical protein
MRHDKAKVDRERKEDIVDTAYTPAKKAATPVVKPVFTTVVSPQPVTIKAANSYLKPQSVLKSSTSCVHLLTMRKKVHFYNFFLRIIILP